MKQQNSLLQLAVIATLSIPLNATAVDVFDTGGIDVGRKGITGAKGPLIFASEQPLETTTEVLNVTKRLVVRFPTLPSIKPNSDNPVFIKVALKGGLKFNTNAGSVALYCKTAGNKITAANINTPPTNGGTQVTFQLKNDVQLDASGLCAMFVRSGTTAGSAGGSVKNWYRGLVVGDHSISALIQYKEGFDNKTASVGGTIISFANSTKSTVAAKGLNGGASLSTAANAVIDVKVDSKKFVAHTSVISLTKAFVGSIKYGSTGLAAVTTANKVLVGNVLKTATLTLEGPSLAGIKSVSITTGDLNAACANAIDTQTPSGTVVSFNKIKPGDISAGVNICMEVDGNTSIPSGLITATLGGNSYSDWKPNFGGTKDVYTFKKNGLSFRVLNIPGNLSTAKDAAGVPLETGNIRLYNTNNFEVAVRGTMYNTNGQLIGTSQEIAKMQPNQTLLLRTDELVTKFGTWSGRARLLLDVDASLFKVVSLVRSPTGTLLNVSAESDD